MPARRLSSIGFLKERIAGSKEINRDNNFDDQTGKFRNAGIRIYYESKFAPLAGLKEGILLEVGFDNTTPNIARDISCTRWYLI